MKIVRTIQHGQNLLLEQDVLNEFSFYYCILNKIKE